MRLLLTHLSLVSVTFYVTLIPFSQTVFKNFSISSRILVWNMTSYRALWLHTGLYKSYRTLMISCRTLWLIQNSYDFIQDSDFIQGSMNHTGLYNSYRILMNTYRTLWPHTGFYDFIQDQDSMTSYRFLTPNKGSYNLIKNYM